jgi:hypothetical protein
MNLDSSGLRNVTTWRSGTAGPTGAAHPSLGANQGEPDPAVSDMTSHAPGATRGPRVDRSNTVSSRIHSFLCRISPKCTTWRPQMADVVLSRKT